MDKLRFSSSVLTSLQQMVASLHRLVGARITIRRKVLVKEDLSMYIDGLIKVRFINRGQTTAVIDDQVFILPGEAYIEGDTAGPGIDHMYEIRFLTTPKNGTSEPSVDEPYVFAGNYLDLRIMHRKYTTRA